MTAETGGARRGAHPLRQLLSHQFHTEDVILQSHRLGQVVRPARHVQCAQEGFKVAVLRASVDASRREDWIAGQLDRGIDVLITNPELVKTGLDLLEFPTIVLLQSGYNVYSLQQAARRSWRIGQKQPVRVI